MSGRHRKLSRTRAATARWVPSLTAAAVSVTGLSTAVVTGTTTTLAARDVALAAAITPANSTAQIFAGSTYYGTDYAKSNPPQQVVPFFLGPQGIVDAVDQNSNDPNVVVVSSGWGAGQTGLALAQMQANHDPALNNVKLVILDNNTNRAGGGFWTTYWMFAPLLGTSAAPEPSDLSVPVIDTAYEYNINSDAPTYPLNLVADANSLAAYGYGYGGQSSAPMPAEALAAQPTDPVHYHYVVAPDGSYTKTAVPGNVTYVTFTTDRLPLVRPLLLVPGGNIVADAVEPALTDIVDAGYQDNQPVPTDPTKTRPVGLLPPASDMTETLGALPGDVQAGVTKAAATAQQDISSPTTLVTGPLDEAGSTAKIITGNLPTSSLSTSSVPGLSGLSPLTSGNKVVPNPVKSLQSTGGSNPAQKVAGSLNSTVSGVSKGVQNAVKKVVSGATE
ncbi:PE-PPE domain-containing protein [Mycolicibacterium brisbanense]|uniref:PE-PPE domain-containing protein n=1 Tax=Mycolicibacterium brisbanense TaxID=146020 RepID=A0A117I7G7_9MYCO|nr:PE-PPE domain-containing protein [Mycolicibacterium brisbanense]MCV7157399.1 PE-PPE domain-containing protein [Mycolicibacterium brisbanense]GAS91515.1 PE-PPE domain-containing protein, precursor [Mycolicibacterium brisbanense]